MSNEQGECDSFPEVGEAKPEARGQDVWSDKTEQQVRRTRGFGW